MREKEEYGLYLTAEMHFHTQLPRFFQSKSWNTYYK